MSKIENFFLNYFLKNTTLEKVIKKIWIKMGLFTYINSYSELILKDYV